MTFTVPERRLAKVFDECFDKKIVTFDKVFDTNDMASDQEIKKGDF